VNVHLIWANPVLYLIINKQINIENVGGAIYPWAAGSTSAPLAGNGFDK